MWAPTYGPIHKFQRVVENLFDVTTDGINPSVTNINFSLADLPNYAEFTALYDLYRIEKIDIEWYPEYTELTDAALVSNAVNVLFNSVVDQGGIGITTVNDTLQFKTLKSTAITKQHKRTLVPSILMGGIAPCSCWLTTSAPSINLYGVSVGIVPTGVAMVFRSRVKYYLAFNNSR